MLTTLKRGPKFPHSNVYNSFTIYLYASRNAKSTPLFPTQTITCSLLSCCPSLLLSSSPPSSSPSSSPSTSTSPSLLTPSPAGGGGAGTSNLSNTSLPSPPPTPPTAL